ncbi:MAG: cell envelope integrity protein CreD [Chitinophagales bacterium]|nr:cell envelope integrity protein CreD [Chitinophagales bacterium]
MEDQDNPQGFDRINFWFRTSVTFKLFTICFLALIMLIPASMIQEIINERERLSAETIDEVSNNVASAQELIGPVITVPLIVPPLANGQIPETNYLHILPEHLNISGDVNPQKLERGIYQAIVYETDLSISGNFDLAAISTIQLSGVPNWDKAILNLGITDMRGIKNQLVVDINGSPNAVIAGTSQHQIASSGVSIPLKGISEMLNNKIDFKYDLDLQGSNNLSFIPIGNTTDIKIKSSWNAPSFNGTFLPDERSVSDSGFEAQWHILQLNRNYPQMWEGNMYSETMHSSAFGVNLIESLDDYQKSMRSVKYAILIIASTFLVFFLVEMMNGKRIHPFQYILVGLALCLFYILLVAISEQLNFNAAYIISAAAIVVMISLYSISIFTSKKLSFLLFAILTVLYGFLFVTLQMSDYALLTGSIGLTIMLASTMYFTRNINWYTIRRKHIDNPELKLNETK